MSAVFRRAVEINFRFGKKKLIFFIIFEKKESVDNNMEQALAGYQNDANAKYGKGSGLHVQGLLIKRGPIGQYFCTGVFYIPHRVNADGSPAPAIRQMSKQRKRRIADGNFKDDEVDTEMMTVVPDCLVSVSLSSGNLRAADMIPGIMYTIRDWQFEHSLEELKDEKGEKTGETERRLGIKAKALTPVKSYKGAMMRGGPEEYFSVFKHLGMLKVPDVFDFSSVPSVLEMPYKQQCLMFRTGVTEVDGRVLTVVRNEQAGEREISFVTEPAPNSKVEKSICFYMSYLMDVDQKEGHMFNVRLYSEALEFGFCAKHPEHMAIWQSCVAPALASSDALTFVGSVDFKNTTKHIVNVKHGTGGDAMEEEKEEAPADDVPVAGFNFGGETAEASYPIKSVRVMSPALFVDFQAVVREVGFVLSPDAALKVWLKAKEERIEGSATYDGALANAHGMTLLNNGNPMYANILRAGQGKHDPDPRFVAVLRIENNSVETVKMNMEQINEAVAEKRVTVAQVLGFLENPAFKTGDAELDRFLKLNLTAVRGQAGRCSLNRCAVYMLADKPAVKPAIEYYLRDHGMLGAPPAANGGPKRPAPVAAETEPKRPAPVAAKPEPKPAAEPVPAEAEGPTDEEIAAAEAMEAEHAAEQAQSEAPATAEAPAAAPKKKIIKKLVKRMVKKPAGEVAKPEE